MSLRRRKKTRPGRPGPDRGQRRPSGEKESRQADALANPRCRTLARPPVYGKSQRFQGFSGNVGLKRVYPARSRQDACHHVAAHIGKTEIASGMPVGEPCVIQTEQMQNRGLQVVDVDRIFCRFVTEFVACTVNDSRTDTTARKNRIEAVRVVVRPVRCLPSISPSAVGIRPNSPHITTSVSSSRPRIFKSASSAEMARSQ